MIDNFEKQQYSKNELIDIYNKAKKGQYNLNNLSLEQIELFNKLIEEEIKLKREQLLKKGLKV